MISWLPYDVSTVYLISWQQIKNDRFGRRGTTARILMRPANSLDILVERPSTWPDPPPGFSTKRILRPGSDYDTTAVDDEDDNHGRRNKRRRRNSDRERPSNSNSNNSERSSNGATGKRRQRTDDPTAMDPASDRLNQGLSSGRAGFSVEEMEALRAAKKNTASSGSIG